MRSRSDARVSTLDRDRTRTLGNVGGGDSRSFEFRWHDPGEVRFEIRFMEFGGAARLTTAVVRVRPGEVLVLTIVNEASYRLGREAGVSD